MKKLIVFAGTTEGRLFAFEAAKNGFDVTVSVATNYGKDVLLESANACQARSESKNEIKIIAGRLDLAAMKKLFSQSRFEAAIDATHPYAENVSENLSSACADCKIKYFRLARNTGDEESESAQSRLSRKKAFFEFAALENAVEQLSKTQGNIFAATGSGELFKFCALQDYKSRVFVRVIPSVQSIQKCLELKFLKSHIIAAQGPFSRKLNRALFKETRSKILVTKQSGRAGGYAEKLLAAEDCRMTVFAIRPPEETDSKENSNQKENKNHENQIEEIGKLIVKLKEAE